MKLLLFFLIGNLSFCQNFKVLDKKTNKGIPYANIDFYNKNGTTSNEIGKFEINDLKGIDSIKISSLGYYTKTISVDNLKKLAVIFLEENVSNLDDVFLKNKTFKILEHQKPLVDIKLKARDFSYEEIVVTYIPFPGFINQDEKVKIKSIIVNTTGLLSKKRRYYPFKVNLYSSNKKYHPPKLKDSLLLGKITSRKKDESNKVKIDISNSEIFLDKKGIYVSFETLEKKDYPQDTLYKAAKALKSIEKENYNQYAAAVRTIPINPKTTKVYSFSLDKKRKILFKDDSIENYWKMEKDFIYDLTIEIEY